MSLETFRQTPPEYVWALLRAGRHELVKRALTNARPDWERVGERFEVLMRVVEGESWVGTEDLRVGEPNAGLEGVMSWGRRANSFRSRA